FLHQDSAELVCPKRVPDQPLALLIRLHSKRRVEHGVFDICVALQRGAHVRGDLPPQVVILGVLIVLKEATNRVVIRLQHGNGIVRWMPRLIIIGMDRLCHGNAPRVSMQRQSAAELSWCMLLHVCKPYAIALRLKRGWWVWAW